MTIVPFIRQLEEKDAGEILHLKQLVFGLPAARMRRLDQIPARHFGLYLDEQLVGLTALTKHQVIIGNAQIEVGGIGAVATHPNCRGQGIMGHLIDHCLTVMKSEKVPLSILWGDRQRYRHFGWETAGIRRQIKLNLRSFADDQPRREIKLQPYDESGHLNLIMTLQRMRPWRVERSESQLRTLLQRPTIMTWLGGEGKDAAYVILENETVIEYGGAWESVKAVCRNLLEQFKHAALTIQTGDEATREADELFELAVWWQSEPLGMLKIIDLVAVLQAYNPILAARWRDAGQLGLAMTDSEQSAVLHRQNGEIVIATGSQDARAARTETDSGMVRLLFGGGATADSRRNDLENVLFPLPFYWPRLDGI